MLSQDARHLATIEQIDAWLLEQARPDNFDDGAPGNVLTDQRKTFGQVCAALADAGFATAGELAVFHFESAIEYLKQKHQPPQD